MRLSTQRLVALQHRDFRLLWLGQLISITGSQMQIVAVDWHIYQLLRGHTYTTFVVWLGNPAASGSLGAGIIRTDACLTDYPLCLVGRYAG